MLDPTYAKNHIPIIASVSEHQPTTWSSFYFDLQFLVFFFPLGLYYCFRNLTNANIFIVLYGTTRYVRSVLHCQTTLNISFSIYFAGVMVRLMLVLAPVACILGGIGLSGLLSSFIPNLDSGKAKYCDAVFQYSLDAFWK
jgi:dolichyl-diphosphooligosaccharide--protein glycosyltransferase